MFEANLKIKFTPLLLLQTSTNVRTTTGVVPTHVTTQRDLTSASASGGIFGWITGLVQVRLTTCISLKLKPTISIIHRGMTPQGIRGLKGLSWLTYWISHTMMEKNWN